MASRFKHDNLDETYRILISENLRVIGENTAKSVSGGSYLTKKYSDFLIPQEQDNRTAEEIVADVLSRANIEVIDE